MAIISVTPEIALDEGGNTYAGGALGGSWRGGISSTQWRGGGEWII